MDEMEADDFTNFVQRKLTSITSQEVQDVMNTMLASTGAVLRIGELRSTTLSVSRAEDIPTKLDIRKAPEPEDLPTDGCSIMWYIGLIACIFVIWACLIGAPMLLAASVLQLFTQMFSGLALGQSETRVRSSPSSAAGSRAKRPETPTQMPSMYTPTTESGEPDPCESLQPSLAAMILQCSCSVRSTSAAVAPADRFLLCLADLVEMCIEDADSGTNAHSDPSPEPVDIRVLARLARVLLQAFFMDPALLAAAAPGSDALAAGAFSGPSDPDEFVPISGSGPLRRSLAFMEQSPLLQVVQRRLCSAHFEDVEGATEQLTHFALRALRVLWFDLRRSTCTLKRIPCDPQEGTMLLCLLMKPLKLQLCCDCDAELASFPYVRLACGAQVTVKGVFISIAVVASTTGMQLRGVDGLNVVVPELEVKLSDAPLLSRIAVSAVLAIFQTTLQDGKRH
eukprot:s3759_g4.t2